ncbi:hypothetical protein ABIE65_004861 [Constrictibacter sp. MBR-5]|uniref:hypothetical protein n=1 Tax=Constrictibacter sp. MBR-5 TaxID=3156467 RepID=UPI003396B44B
MKEGSSRLHREEHALEGYLTAQPGIRRWSSDPQPETLVVKMLIAVNISIEIVSRNGV